MALKFQVKTIHINDNEQASETFTFDNSVREVQAAVQSFELKVNSGGEREVAYLNAGVLSVTQMTDTSVQVTAYLKMSNGGNDYTVSGQIRALVIADVGASGN